MELNSRTNILKNPKTVAVVNNLECGLCLESFTNAPFNLQKDKYKDLNLCELYFYVTKLPAVYPLDVLICSSCCGKLITSYEFIEMCLQSSQLLINRLPLIKDEDGYTDDILAQEDSVQINSVDKDPDEDEAASNTESNMGTFSRKRVVVVPNYKSNKRKVKLEKTIQPKSEPDDFDMIPSENLVYWGSKDTGDPSMRDKILEPLCDTPTLQSNSTLTSAKQYSEPYSLDPTIHDGEDVDVKHYVCSKCFSTFWSMEELQQHNATHT